MSAGDAFDGLNDLSGGCCGDALYEKVDVVAVGANFDEVDFISLLYFKTGLGECFDHTVGQHFSSVLHWTYDVMQQTGFVVALGDMAVFHSTNIHLTSLPSQQAARQCF